MKTSELIKKVHKIEIKTKGLSNHIFAGEYNTAFKGKGMAFSEVREYQPGDDIRLIDWNVTAIHSVLLPDYSVMTFGTFGTESKEKANLRKNKKIKFRFINSKFSIQIKCSYR